MCLLHVREKAWLWTRFLDVSMQNHCGWSKSSEELLLVGIGNSVSFIESENSDIKETKLLILPSSLETWHWPLHLRHCVPITITWEQKYQNFASQKRVMIIPMLMSCSLTCIPMYFPDWETKGRQPVYVCKQYPPLMIWRLKFGNDSHHEQTAASVSTGLLAGSRLCYSVSSTPSTGAIISEI